MWGRPGTSGVWSPRRSSVAGEPSGPPAGGVGAGRHAGHRLGRDRPAVGVLRGAGLEPVAVRVFRRQPARRGDHGCVGRVLRGARRGPRPCCPTGWAASRAARSPGWWCPPRTMCVFATHYGFRPDFCEGHDPESKGLVENLVGYVKSDLMIPDELTVADLAAANAAGACGAPRSTPRSTRRSARSPPSGSRSSGSSCGRCRRCGRRSASSCIRKVDRLSCVRFGSARYSVPTRHIGRQVEVRVVDGQLQVILLGAIIATHALVPPGETSIDDDHYGGPRPATPAGGPPKTPAEIAFCALGPAAVAFIKAAAAAGERQTGSRSRRTRRPGGGARPRRPDRRARTGCHLRPVPGRDVRSILAAGTGVARPTRPGEALIVELPSVATRPLSDYAIGENAMTAPAPPRRRSRGRPAPAAARRHAPPRPRAVGHRQDPTLDARGAPPHPLEAEIASRDAPTPGPGSRPPGSPSPRPSTSSTSPSPRSTRPPSTT